MTGLFAAAAGFARGLSPRAWLGVAAAAASILILVLVYVHGRADAENDARARADRAQAAAQRRADRGADRAASERTVDDRAIQDLREELTHAVTPIPDAVPSDRRRALNCARLRRDGWAVDDLPACGGPVGEP